MVLKSYIILVPYLQMSLGALLTFQDFQLKHNKSYSSTAELTLKEKIYNENIAKINDHNEKFEKGLVSYQLGVNQFTDMTEEEFASRSKVFLLNDTEFSKNMRTSDNRLSTNASLPTSIDWRTKGIVTDVKDQGNCGSCWAFATTGTLEGQLALYNGNLTSLSEQQLIDCNTYGNKGCNGGNLQYAFDYYIADNGLTTEANYPYKAKKGSCSSNKKSVVWVDGFNSIRRNDESDLKRAVGLIGPIAVAINANPLQSYKSGIFMSNCPGSSINHAVLVVGYGTDSTYGDYWIIKNSWGSSWGENGYFRMTMGSNLCGIAYQGCYPTAVRPNDDTIIITIRPDSHYKVQPHYAAIPAGGILGGLLMCCCRCCCKRFKKSNL